MKSNRNPTVQYALYSGPTRPASDRIFEAVISIQNENRLDHLAGNSFQGFLATAFTLPEAKALFHNDGTLIIGRRRDSVVGFVLCTPLVVFTRQYAGPGNQFVQTKQVPLQGCRYLYQLAVVRSELHRGIGSAMLRELRSHVSSPLITDTLTAPASNTASAEFFKKHGFENIGFLTLNGYRDFGPLRSDVYYEAGR